MSKPKHRHPQRNTNTNPKQPLPPGETPSPTIEAEKHNAVIAKAPQDQPAKKEGQKMEPIRLTDKIIAAATVVIALAAIFQYCEMHSGGVDTHNLASAAVASNRAWIAVKGTAFGYLKDKAGIDRASSNVVVT